MSRVYKTFLEHEATVRRIFGRYFRRSEDVEDLTQETFLRCFAAETKEHIREPKAFLLRVAKNIALSEVKKKSRTATDYLEDSSFLDVLGDDSQICADVQLDSKRKLVVLTKIVAGLPEDCRRAFLMRKMEKLKYDQIALRLNVSLSTVHRLIARAMLHCSAALREQGYDIAEFGAENLGKKQTTEATIATITPGAGQNRNNRG
jgi:RNA polymerase sigma-70 factor (ECF subfamily)